MQLYFPRSILKNIFYSVYKYTHILNTGKKHPQLGNRSKGIRSYSNNYDCSILFLGISPKSILSKDKE